MEILKKVAGDDVEARANAAGADMGLLISHAEKAWARLGLPDLSAGDPGTLPHAQQDALCRGMTRSLYMASHIGEVAFIGDVCRAQVLRDAAMFRQVGRAYRTLARRADVQELATVDLGPGAAPDLRAAQYQMRLGNPVGPSTDDYEREWGPIASNLDTALANLRTDSARVKGLSELARALMVARDERSMTLTEMEDRLAWGRAASDFFFFLVRFRGAQRANAQKGTLSAAAKQILALAQEAQAMYQPADLSAYLARRDEGRSLLVAQTHSGITAYNRPILQRANLPETLIAGNSRTNFQNDDMITLGLRGDFRKDFIRLVKIVKRQQRLIRIFPDGHSGERWQMPFLGTTVSFGLGSSLLAWHARAAVFTYKSSWRGGRFGMEMYEGPLASHDKRDDNDREAFDEAFYGFYADHLRDIALGPPEDIVGHGGIWVTLVSAFADAQTGKGDLQ